MSNNQASPPLISGRELRWARNVVKKWEQDHLRNGTYYFHPDDVDNWAIATEIRYKRYERACALILADKLRNS